MTKINTLEELNYSDFLPKETWTEVYPNLWQGGTDDNDVLGCIEDEPFITEQDFDTVVTLHAWTNPADWGVKELRHPFHDGVVGKDISPEDLFFLVKFVNDELNKGKRVLVRCLAGLNRSGLVNALVLVRKGVTVQEALKHLRKVRSEWVLCNEDFEKWFLQINEDDWRGDELPADE